ncbi:MAG TPA: hypothetical protein VNL14_14850 [Candidatus Acidoferrales bacterium]|nr:hypothetical protein [Candidatus Acidoferrales bacterium]
MGDREPLEPAIAVEQVSTRQAGAGAWHIEWNITNLGASPLTILAARFPHGQFRSPERPFADPYRLAPGQSALLEAEITCPELPGTIVENAFLILSVVWSDRPWRIFARLRVTIESGGAPRAATELITAQPSGFAEKL